MPYTQPTLAEAATALASRLNDPDSVHWVVPELYGYLAEALRTWNAWTQHFRDQGSFTTTVGEAFYDLPTELTSLRGQTLTNWTLVADLQYALIEPAAAGGTWTGTDQFTLAQLSAAIQRRRDQFLRETGAVLTRTVTTYASPAGSGRIDLDETASLVRRAAWRDTASQALFPLLRTDEWAANNFQPAWVASADPPNAYSVSAVPPLTMQVIPPPNGAGDLDLVAIHTGAAVDPLVSSVLGIPDDFAWVIKYGALADLLGGDGLALDPQREAYCEARWEQGLESARRASVVLAARINGSPCPVAALADADSYSATWQLLPGVPEVILTAGQTLVATWPPAGATGGPWTILLDVVRNAPVPTLTTDVLQIGQDVYDSILDLAQHLALFKEGPGQNELSQALLERATRAAGVEVRIQQASQPSRAPLLGQTKQDERVMPRELDPVGE